LNCWEFDEGCPDVNGRRRASASIFPLYRFPSLSVHLFPDQIKRHQLATQKRRRT
jgi:hypothetical protein